MMANFTKCVVLVIAAAVFQTSEVRSIVGGHASLPGAAPYIVAIKTTSASTLLCAGVLIKTTWILTTAQCVNDKTAADLKILTGSHRLLTSKELLLVSKIERHPSYKPASSEYNLALLQLSAAVSLSSRVATVVLNDEPIISGIPVVFFGWGASSYGSLAHFINVHCQHLIVALKANWWIYQLIIYVLSVNPDKLLARTTRQVRWYDMTRKNLLDSSIMVRSAQVARQTCL
uniref:Peptidase S1 domain-containing protein n=1 Tax=Anopheles coluzzii TaxID=1518534 RepID=A0A8W7P7D1_ANOCL